MTEYHQFLNRQAYGLFLHSSLWRKMSKVNPATFHFHFFEAHNDALEVQF